MTALSSIWDVATDLTWVNALSAGAAFLVNKLFPNKPDKDDDDKGPSDEPHLPLPTGGDWNWEKFNRELDEIGKDIHPDAVLTK